jgi:hypothetical protein
MTATLWINTDKDETVALGGMIEFYQAFDRWRKLAGGPEKFYKEYPNLNGLRQQVESQEDADPDWFKDVQREAADFLKKYGSKLTQDEGDVLGLLVEGPEGTRARWERELGGDI